VKVEGHVQEVLSVLKELYEAERELNPLIRVRRAKRALSSDPLSAEVSQACGIMHEELRGLHGVAKRSGLTIDREEIVRYKGVSDDPGVKLDLREISRALVEGLGG
jgi:peroxiredoxin